MRDKKEFFSILNSIDGKDFSEYSSLIGDFDFSRYVLKITQSPENAESDPCLFVVRVPQIIAGFPAHLFNTPVRRTALEDLLTRKLGEAIERVAQYDREGVSRRRLAVAVPGQKILPRTSLLVTEEFVEARIYVDLPARDGFITGESAQDVFFDHLPAVVTAALIYCNLDEKEVDHFVDLMEDADQIRQMLPTRGFVAFAADGSMVVRERATDLPDYESTAVLSVPEDLLVELDVPNTGAIKGLGIPSGITVVLGDNLSGRTELLRAVASGIYNHVPGDGREFVVTVPDAVYVASEPGRSIQRVDVTAFTGSELGEVDMTQLTTEEANACVSQAAGTVEALEVGARVLIFDEADSSSAFLAGDSRLAKILFEGRSETPSLASRARQLVDELGVSIIVGGASCVAEFVPIADTVLCLDGLQVRDVTPQAKELGVSTSENTGQIEDISSLVEKNRWVVPSSLDPSVGTNDYFINALATDVLEFGKSLVDLQGIFQLADIHQTETIGVILYYAKLRYMDEGRPIREILDLVDRDLSTEGLECLSRDLRGDLARPRRYEIAAALNRLDTLRISHAVE
ncbi:MAG: ABC-ATPase domain-containing protein [Verrucomicrobia bacterium]|nr:ABC-ATPase domain-containing protein [Verrucomicrobiota bacterium]